MMAVGIEILWVEVSPQVMASWGLSTPWEGMPI